MDVVVNRDLAELVVGVQLSYPPGMMNGTLDVIDKKVPKELAIDGASYVKISMPCREEFTVAAREDFPTLDVPCSCGNENHFFIKHEIQKGEVQ